MKEHEPDMVLEKEYESQKVGIVCWDWNLKLDVYWKGSIFIGGIRTKFRKLEITEEGRYLVWLKKT